MRLQSHATGPFVLRRRLQVSFVFVFHIQYGQRRVVQLEISATKNTPGIQGLQRKAVSLSMDLTTAVTTSPWAMVTSSP